METSVVIGRFGRFADAVRWLPRGFRSAGARRARWGVVDQGISSATNFAITAAVAHQVAPEEFGSFSLALAVYICLLWVARSLVGEPFAVRMTAVTDSTRQVAARHAVGAAAVIGLISGAAMVAVRGAVESRSGGALMAMGAFMPALLVQDSYRYVLIVGGRAASAAVNDALWFGVQSLVITGLLLTGHPGATGLTVAFGAGATAASALGAWQCRATPSPRSWLMWLRAQRDLGIPFVTELLVVNAAPQISMLGVAALGGVVAVGELRAAIFLCSPPTVLFSGLVLVAVPEAVRLRSRSLPGLRALVLGLAVLMTVTTGLWAAALRLVPSTVGSALLGPNWGRGRHLLVPVAIFVALTACMLAALVGLRALEATRASLRVRSWAGPVTLTVTVIGAYTGGSEGAAVGLGASALFSAILTWAAFQRAVVSEATYISHGRKPRLLDPDAASP